MDSHPHCDEQNHMFFTGISAARALFGSKKRPASAWRLHLDENQQTLVKIYKAFRRRSARTCRVCDVLYD
jgi:hypothetical protein